MTGLEKLLRWHSMRGGISTQEATATGNPATFETTLARPLVSCVVPFTPMQSGSGTPSPSNNRPFIGLSGLTVRRSAQSTDNPDVFPILWADKAGTLYGGYVDVISGTLIQEFDSVVFDGSSDENWSVENGNNFYVMTPSTFVRNTTSTSLYCNLAQSHLSLVSGLCKISNSGNFNINIGAIINVHTVNDFRAWLAVNNVQIVCQLQNSVAYQLDPKTIRTLSGTNVVWTDTNGTNTVKYLKKG